MNWQDNSKYSLTEGAERLLPLANCPVSALLNSNIGKKLLVFPHSLQDCKDKIKENHIFDMYPTQEGHQVKTYNMAGFFGINGMHITIRSRFAQNSEDYLLHYLLQRVLNLNIFDLKHTVTNDAVFDLLLLLFPHYLNNALRQGLFKEYQRNAYNNSNVRGTIDVGRHIRCNIPFTGRIAYNTREFSHDNHVTQLIRHTIEYIRTYKTGRAILHHSPNTQADVAQIIAATPAYHRNDRERILRLNLRPLCHPYFTYYTDLQNICLRILRHEQLKYGKDQDVAYGILFDVSWLWEEYLATLLTTIGFHHPDNRQHKGGIYLATGSHRFVRFPDFYDTEPDGIVLDAKYKQEINTVDDVNQMVTYMYRLKSRIGAFIQPTNGTNVVKNYQLKGWGENNFAQLQTISLRIPTTATDYDSFSSQMADTEKWLTESLQSLKNYCCPLKNSQSKTIS